MKKNRFLSAMMALVLVLGTLSSAFAAEEFVSKMSFKANVTYRVEALDGKTVSVKASDSGRLMVGTSDISRLVKLPDWLVPVGEENIDLEELAWVAMQTLEVTGTSVKLVPEKDGAQISIFVDGVECRPVTATLYADGNVGVQWKSLRKIFREAESIRVPASSEQEVSLELISKHFGYAFSINGGTVNLCKGQLPVVLVTVDGRQVAFGDFQPTILDGRTLVPMAVIAEALGYEAKWFADTATAVVSKGQHSVSFTKGSNLAFVDGTPVKLDVPAQILQNGKFYLQLSVLLPALGGVDYSWVPGTNGGPGTVVITTTN